MNTETVLKNALAAEADSLGAIEDPWPGFEKLERTHKRRRRTGIAGVAVALAALAGVQAGVVPLPAFVPGIAVTGGPGVLAEGATRGSLAGDTAFLDGLRREIKNIEDPGETWRVADRKKIKFVYAAEVAGHRLVLALVPLRFGFLDDSALVWYDGEPGAAPAQMHESGRVDGGEPVVTFSQAGSDGPGLLVVVGPGGSTVTASIGFRYSPAGRVERDANEVVSAGSGLLEAELPAAPIPPAIKVTVTSGADVLYEGGAGGGWASSSGVNPQEASEALIARALGNREFDHATLRGWVSSALSDARLAANGTKLTVRWLGTVNGQPAALFTIRPEGGGVLAYAMHGSGNSYRQDLRLLLPAAGVDKRPIAWRMRAEGKDDRTDQVIVTAPPGTERLELAATGSAPLSLTPDATGAAIASVAPFGEATVTAYTADGTRLGSTPVPPFETDMGGLPGEDGKTRIVE